MKHVATHLLAIIAAALLTSCATDPAYLASGEPVSDRDIISDVTQRLEADTLTGRTTFGVSVESGVVTVQGAVRGEQMRHRVLAIAKSSPGVVDVVDRLSVW